MEMESLDVGEAPRSGTLFQWGSGMFGLMGGIGKEEGGADSEKAVLTPSIVPKFSTWKVQSPHLGMSHALCVSSSGQVSSPPHFILAAQSRIFESQIPSPRCAMLRFLLEGLLVGRQ